MARPMDREAMRDEVYARLGETAGFFTDAQINQWLNDGMDDVALKLEPKVSSATLDTEDAKGEYELPDNLISIKTALYLDSSTDEWLPLSETTYLELFRSNPDWEHSTVTTIPTHWYWRPEGVIGVFPIPDNGTTGGLRIIYTCRPDEMDEDTDTTTMPDWLDRVVVLYAVMRCRFKERDEKKALVARAEWERATDLASVLINKHRKEHGPKIQPKQRTYRSYWYGRNPRFKAWSNN